MSKEKKTYLRVVGLKTLPSRINLNFPRTSTFSIVPVRACVEAIRYGQLSGAALSVREGGISTTFAGRHFTFWSCIPPSEGGILPPEGGMMTEKDGMPPSQRAAFYLLRAVCHLWRVTFCLLRAALRLLWAVSCVKYGMQLRRPGWRFRGHLRSWRAEGTCPCATLGAPLVTSPPSPEFWLRRWLRAFFDARIASLT